MADEVLKNDANFRRVIAGITNDANQYVTMFRVDPTTKGLVVYGTSQSVGYSTITSGRKASTSVGTAVAIVGVSTPCKKITISIPTNNTSSQVAIGDSTALATVGSERGQILISGSSTDIYTTDAANIYVDVGTSGDAITFNIFN